MDASQAPIRVQETQPSKPSKKKGNASAISWVKKMTHPLTYAIIGVVLVSVGFGAWSYFGLHRQTNEADSNAELDGLEFPSPAFDSPKDVKLSHRVPIRKISGTETPNERAIPTGTKDQISIKRQDHFAAVWLTGTIEEVERNDSADSIRRISGGRSESSNLR